ncbi:MAG: hypothetical protein WCT04_12040 [Planctomycetota bacterium]
MTFSLPRCTTALLLCAALSACVALSADKSENVFDKGTDPDLKTGAIYKEKKPSELRKDAELRREKMKKKEAESVAAHIKTLRSSKDELDQSSAAEYLGVMRAYIAIPDLIDCLNPTRRVKDSVMRAANGSLINLTQKNFGVQGYEQWNTWWIKSKVEFLAKLKDEVPETDRIMAESANTQGLELMKIFEYRSAYNQFLVALEKNPKVPDYHNNAGIALMELGRPLDAMEYFNETIGINKDLPQPYMNIGRCYSRMDRGIEAQSWFSKAKEKDKDGRLWDIFWMIGKEYLKAAQYKSAYEYLDQARTKAEQQRIRDPRLYNDLAICHYGLDQYHSAWKEISNIRFLGFEPNADFVAKVRKVLIAGGTDPDEEDELARKQFALLIKGDETEKEGSERTAKTKQPSTIDTLNQK